MIRWSAASTPSAAYCPAPAAGTDLVVSRTVPPPSRSTTVASPASNDTQPPLDRRSSQASWPTARVVPVDVGPGARTAGRSGRRRRGRRGRRPSRSRATASGSQIEHRNDGTPLRISASSRIAESPGVPAPTLSPTSSRTTGRGSGVGERLVDRLVGFGAPRRRIPPASPRRAARAAGAPRRRAPGRRRRSRRRPCPCARRRRTGSPRRCWPTASRARARARARRRGRCASDREAEPWQRMLSASGGFSIAWTGAISPRTVRAISSAQVSARSRQSTCGLVCQASVTVAGAICAGEMLPWVSTTTPIGTRGPTTARTRRIISASASGCSSRPTPRAAPSGRRRMVPRPRARRRCGPTPSRTPRGSIVPLGGVVAKTSGTTSMPARLSAAWNPAIVVFAPAWTFHSWSPVMIPTMLDCDAPTGISGKSSGPGRCSARTCSSRAAGRGLPGASRLLVGRRWCGGRSRGGRSPGRRRRARR